MKVVSKVFLMSAVSLAMVSLINAAPAPAPAQPGLVVTEPIQPTTVNVNDEVMDADVLGTPLNDADLDERGASPMIVVVVVRGATQVLITTCAKKESCRTKAAIVAGYVGGRVLDFFVDNAIKTAYCKSSIGKKYPVVAGKRFC